MAKHQWTIVCEQAIVDRFSNNLTIVGVVEQFNITLERVAESATDETPPVVPSSFSIVSMWHRSNASVEEETSVRVRILSPSGAALTRDSEQRLVLTGEKLRARNILNLRNVPIRENGEYHIHVQSLQKTGKWRTEATIRIPVQIKIVALGAAPAEN